MTPSGRRTHEEIVCVALSPACSGSPGPPLLLTRAKTTSFPALSTQFPQTPEIPFPEPIISPDGVA